MNNGKEFTDIIGTINRTEMKDLLASKQINSPILHGTGITTTSCIHGYTIHIEVFRKLLGAFFLFRGILPYVMEWRRSQCMFGFFECIE